jgi:hypothetical protein
MFIGFINKKGDRILDSSSFKFCEKFYGKLASFDTLIENFNEKIIIFEPYYEGALNYKISKSLNNKKYNITNVGVPHVFLTNYGTKKEHDKNLGLDKIGIKKIFEECL